MILIKKILIFLRLEKVKQKNIIYLNVFCYENNLVYPVYVSNKEFEDHMCLLLIPDKNKSYYGYIKHFNKFMCNKTKK